MFIDQSGFSNVIHFESVDVHVDARDSTKARFVLLFKRKPVQYVYYLLLFFVIVIIKQ